jgi:hypothetical protein
MTNSWADNDGFCYAVNGTALECWFTSDEDARTEAGSEPSYEENVVKRVAFDGKRWGESETMYDSPSNVEVTVFYSGGIPVIATCKGYWPTTRLKSRLIVVVNPREYLDGS